MAAPIRFLTLAAAVTMGLTLVAVCPGASPEFSAPEKTALFPRDIAAGMTVPKWINGRMVSLLTVLDHNDARANVHVYDADGRKIYQARVWPGQTSRVALTDVAVSPAGDVVVVGYADDRSPHDSFFARINPAGVVSATIRIQPFEGMNVTFGPDGTLWILGWEADHLRNFGPDHATLRRFTLDGELLGEFLPWSSFGCPPRRHPAFGGAKAALLASRDRVVVLTADCPQWIELDPEGAILRRESLAGIGLLPALLAAVTSDNRIYMRPDSALSICRLEIEQRACKEIQTPENYTLLGADGAALVLQNRSVIEWRKPVE
jgi:hypothetical protein